MLSGIFGGSKLPAAEQQNFEKEKSRLSKEVHKQALVWFDQATYGPKEGIVDSKEFSVAIKTDTQTKKSQMLLVKKQEVLGHIPAGYDCDKIIQGLSKSDRAAFDYFYNQTLKDYSSKELEVPAKIIKDIENIKDLKKSNLLKVATLQFMQDVVDENLFDDKYIKLWK